MQKILLLLICSSAYINSYAQNAGVLDSTFNTNGIYTHDFGFHDNLNDITVQPNQKIICTGVALTPAFAAELKVLRLKTDGTPDSSFATNGVYSMLIGNETYGYESYVQPDGKIIVAGLTYDANYNGDWLLLRLDSTGVLDSAFGTNGMTFVDFFTRDDIAQAVTMQPDGKILVSGTYTDTINYFNNPVIGRFNANGSIDTAFGINGFVAVAGIDIDNELTSIAMQKNGKIVAAGHYSKVFTGAMDFDVFVMCVDSNGILDASFGVNGVVKTSVNGGIDDAFGMETDNDGNIFVAGFTTLPVTLYLDMILLKYDSTGTLDSNFGTSGIVTFNNADEDVAYDLKIQSDNKIVVAGSSGIGFFGPRSATVWRYLPNGTPDNTFGINGFVTTDIYPTFQDYNAVALQADGKIICAGRTNNGTQNDIATVRYINDLTTSITEMNTQLQIKLFPNPARPGETVTVQLENNFSSIIKIQLTELTGKEILTQQIAAGKKHFTYQLPKSLSPGIYFITIFDGKSVHVEKVAVE